MLDMIILIILTIGCIIFFIMCVFYVYHINNIRKGLISLLFGVICVICFIMLFTANINCLKPYAKDICLDKGMEYFSTHITTFECSDQRNSVTFRFTEEEKKSCEVLG